jgi:hypothetical protein
MYFLGRHKFSPDLTNIQAICQEILALDIYNAS